MTLWVNPEKSEQTSGYPYKVAPYMAMKDNRDNDTPA
jgi:hypothetical protein